MPLSLITARHATSEEWDTVHAACSYATFFHSRCWAEIWESYSDGRIRPEPRHLRFSDGTEVTLPVSVQSSRILRRRTALLSPAGTYGGPIAFGQLTDDHARLVVAYMQRCWKNIEYRSNPYLVCKLPPIGSCVLDTTQHIALERIATSSLELQNRGHRSSVAKAKRAGIRIEPASTADDWARYTDMYEESVHRWGSQATSHYTPRLFNILYHQSLTDPNIALWLAKSRETPVAGAIILSAPKIDIYWHGAALQSYFHLRPVNLLLAELIDRAHKRGKDWFDFNPSGGHEGVARFKRGFGSMSTECNIHISNSMITAVTHKLASARHITHEVK